MQWWVSRQAAATGMPAKVRRSSRSSKPTFLSGVPLPFVLPSWAIGLQACPSDADKYEPNCFKIAPKTKTNYDCVSNCEDKWFLQHSKSPLYCPSPDTACIDFGFSSWTTHHFQTIDSSWETHQKLQGNNLRKILIPCDCNNMFCGSNI